MVAIQIVFKISIKKILQTFFVKIVIYFIFMKAIYDLRTSVTLTAYRLSHLVLSITSVPEKLIRVNVHKKLASIHTIRTIITLRRRNGLTLSTHIRALDG